MSWA